MPVVCLCARAWLRRDELVQHTCHTASPLGDARALSRHPKSSARTIWTRAAVGALHGPSTGRCSTALHHATNKTPPLCVRTGREEIQLSHPPPLHEQRGIPHGLPKRHQRSPPHPPPRPGVRETPPQPPRAQHCRRGTAPIRPTPPNPPEGGRQGLHRGRAESPRNPAQPSAGAPPPPPPPRGGGGEQKAGPAWRSHPLHGPLNTGATRHVHATRNQEGRHKGWPAPPPHETNRARDWSRKRGGARTTWNGPTSALREDLAKCAGNTTGRGGDEPEPDRQGCRFVGCVGAAPGSLWLGGLQGRRRGGGGAAGLWGGQGPSPWGGGGGGAALVLFRLFWRAPCPLTGGGTTETLPPCFLGYAALQQLA